MRMLVVVSVFLLGCGGSNLEGEACPAAMNDGDACSFSGTCWHEDTFSPCLSGWCSCESGRVVCEALAPRTGDACGAEPITSCGYEGTLTCDTAPTSEYCYCNDDGTWHCVCACYGAGSTCGQCPADLPIDEVEGLPCKDAGDTCSYPTATCTCMAGGDQNRFHCTP
jgi:hypothetical protein